MVWRPDLISNRVRHGTGGLSLLPRVTWQVSTGATGLLLHWAERPAARSTAQKQKIMEPGTMHTGNQRQRSAAIIGAGFGGVGAAIRLLREGIDDITVFERSPGVGGGLAE